MTRKDLGKLHDLVQAENATILVVANTTLAEIKAKLDVGDMSKVEFGMRDLNFGEAHKIDVDENPVQ